jgi:hypothetical protein
MNSHIEFIKYHAPRGYIFAAAWFHRQASGEIVSAIGRYDSDGTPCTDQKTFRAFRIEGANIDHGGMIEPRPLYNLVELITRPEADVLVVEGEGTADAAAKLFPNMVVVTSVHGAKSPNKTDWTTLQGRNDVHVGREDVG